MFLNTSSSAAAMVFYLPGACTHTDTEGKQRKTSVRNILKSLEKTQYLMNTLYSHLWARQTSNADKEHKEMTRNIDEHWEFSYKFSFLLR